MRVMLLGVGAIGTVIAKHLAGHRAVESLTLGDMDTRRAESLARQLGGKNLQVERIDAADTAELERSLKGYGLVVCAILPRFHVAVMDAALKAGSHYLDLAADEVADQLAKDAEWKKAGLLAPLVAILGF